MTEIIGAQMPGLRLDCYSVWTSHQLLSLSDCQLLEDAKANWFREPMCRDMYKVLRSTSYYPALAESWESGHLDLAHLNFQNTMVINQTSPTLHSPRLAGGRGISSL